VSTLIVGCGYLGRRVGRLLHRRGERVFGTARTAGRAAELVGWGVEPIRADVLDPVSLAALPAVDRVFYCVGFDRGAGVPLRAVWVDGLRHVLGRLIDRAGGLVYAGSTGVYGQDDGGWVDEDSPTAPRHEAGQVGLEAEGVVREVAGPGGLPAAILRFSGLYGPGRIIRREALGRGEPIVGDPARYLNLIHVDDAAAAVVAALERARPGQVYLVSDDRPVERREYYTRAAEHLLAPAPRFEPPAPGSSASRREEANKRVSNRRMKAELGVCLTYPDLTTGIPAALMAERDQEDPCGTAAASDPQPGTPPSGHPGWTS
jgi:nucleoside-diphosphate-sugar epimerase